MGRAEPQQKTWRRLGVGWVACFVAAAFLLGLKMGTGNYEEKMFSFSSPNSVTVHAVQPQDRSSRLEPAEFGQVDIDDEEGCMQWLKSQHGEEKALFSAFWSSPAAMVNGYYLELGALDGVFLSNTVWLDKCLGWNGMLIEGHPKLTKDLMKNRPRADIIPEAVCEEEGTIEFVGNTNGLSGLSDAVDKKFLQNKDPTYHTQVFTVKCGPLHAYLADGDIKHIDFWSLDVEGAEWIVLNTFDWDAVTVHVLIIENDKDKGNDRQKRHDLLRGKSFEFRGEIGVNEIWVNPANARPGITEIYYGNGLNVTA